MTSSNQNYRQYMQIESLTKATHGAEMLVSDIRAAHLSCNNRMLEMLLSDLIRDAARISARLNEITAAVEVS